MLIILGSVPIFGEFPRFFATGAILIKCPRGNFPGMFLLCALRAVSGGL